MAELLVVTEEGESLLVAYAPDLPGCVVTAATRDELRSRMGEAVRAHLASRGEAPVLRHRAEILHVELPEGP